jgi:uncharacterized protein (DUF736 family)
MPQRLRLNFLPLRCAHSSRDKKVSPPASSAALRPARGAASIVSGSSIAIEAAVVAGSKTAQGDKTMANIGTFKKMDNGEYQGDIVTLSLQARGVRIVPEPDRTNDKAPTHRVFIGRVEVGAGWTKTAAQSSREYLSLKLDDPSFRDAIFANLTQDGDEGDTFSLIWSRQRSKTGD